MRLYICLVLCLVLSVPLFGDIYHFSLTDGKHTVSFSLPSNPTPDLADNGYGFSFFSLAMVHDGASVNCNVDFWNAASAGGMTIYNGGCGNTLMDGMGSVLYTGPVNSPTFELGTFTLKDFGDSAERGPFTLTITDPSLNHATPEPASAVLLMTGGLALLLGSRRRSNPRF
jgi:hypothetical protein